MAVNTLLIDFSVDPSETKNESQLTALTAKIENILRDYLSNLKPLNSLYIDNGILKLFSSDMGAVTSLRVYSNGLITLSIDYFKEEQQLPLLTFQKCKQLEHDMVEKLLGLKRSQAFAPIKRCKFDRYFSSSDERLLEYDIDKIVFEERTPYQKVQIVHSKSLGNMLVLDDLQNISEADLIYTETLMARGTENYKDKEIIILGGGDGALLFELLKEKPRNVIMLEIDDVVMKSCAKYMRSICGDVLDSMSGTNYQIVVGDCMKSLEEFVKEGRKFDYIFGDLTDIPISGTPSGELWNFIVKILEMSFKLLKPSGKFMTHGNGTSCEESLKMYESQLMMLKPPVSINKSTAFVPSFLENWVFYQISFVDNV